jgi:hypothetical protein
VGLSVLATLAILLGAAWYMTNDTRVRDKAKEALEALTGAEVDIDHAQFDLFEGVRLRGVRMRISGDDSPRHFFTARELILRHAPWQLLLRGVLQPTEIVCIEPEVNLEHNIETNRLNIQGLVQPAPTGDAPPSDEPPLPLPKIVIKDGLLRTAIRSATQRQVNVNDHVQCTLQPNGRTYDVRLEMTPLDTTGHGSDTEWARLRLNMDSGTISGLSGTASHRLFGLLPPEYQMWVRRYGLRGNFEVVEDSDTQPDQGKYKIRLADLSLRLPKEQGGMGVENVRGYLLFTPEGVEMRKMTGTLPEVGDAKLTLSGHYNGYSQTSPFEIRCSLRRVLCPRSMEGPLRESIRMVRQDYQPVGHVDIDLHYKRFADGRTRAIGTIGPHINANGKSDLQITYRDFPMPVRVLSGKAVFNERYVHTMDFKTKHEATGGLCSIKGTFSDPEYDSYNLTFRGTNVHLGESLKNAMPKEHLSLWDSVQPDGRADGVMRMACKGKGLEKTMTVTILPKGKASATYLDFPYPLGKLTGRIEFAGQRMRFIGLTGKQGDATVTIDGTIDNLATTPVVHMNVVAKQIPLDSTLRKSLDPEWAKTYDSLKPSGTLREVRVALNTQKDTTLDASITATLDGASLTYAPLPYRLDQVRGQIGISATEVTLGHREKGKVVPLTGMHGKAKIYLAGRIDVSEDEPKFYLDASGTNVAIDASLQKALPKEMRGVFDQLAPAGTADVKVTLAPGKEDGAADYRVVVNARDMSLQYEAFPYRLTGVTGQAIATPGTIKLIDVTSTKGKMTTAMSGVITQSEAGQSVRLAVSAKNVPLDKAFLSALPEGLLPLTKQVTPGGRVNIELPDLRFYLPAESKSTDTPEADWTWSAAGGLGFRDLTVDFGFGRQTLTGTLRGRMQQEKGKTALQAEALLQQLKFGDHVISNVRGRLAKQASGNVLQVTQLVGKAYGGKLAGEASIRLKDPLTMELSLSAQNVDLGTFYNRGAKGASGQSDVEGKLSGQLQLTVSSDKKIARQAAGEIVFSKGKLYKLPVVLGFFTIIYLTVPGETAFEEGFVRYHLKGDKLVFREIYLTGKTISILGAGMLDTKTSKLKLTFLTAPPGKLAPMSELADDILRAISNTLVEIRVTGTVKHPKMKTVPLSPLDTILRRLAQPGKER